MAILEKTDRRANSNNRLRHSMIILGNSACRQQQLMIRDGRFNSVDELHEIDNTIIKLAKELSNLLCAACDVTLWIRQIPEFRKILMASQGFKDAEQQAPLYFRTTLKCSKKFKEDSSAKDKAYEYVIENPKIKSNKSIL